MNKLNKILSEGFANIDEIIADACYQLDCIIDDSLNKDTFMFNMFYGEYQLRPCGLDFIRTWQHNPFSRLSREEQYRLNSQNYDDFSETEIQKGLINIIAR